MDTLHHKWAAGNGNPNAKILILGESPALGELDCLSTNKELRSMLAEAGINESSVWKTTVCKHYVPPNPKKGKKIPFYVRAKNYNVDIDAHLTNLYNEIKAINPNVILALGNTALLATTGNTGIADYRGSILSHGKYKVVATYDPRGLSWQEQGEFTGYWNKHVIMFDFMRALAQSTFPEIRRPYRNLHIATSSLQLQEFRNRNKLNTRPAIDIEARGSCLPFCLGISFNPSEGICMPFWNQGEIRNIAHISDQEIVQMWLILSEILSLSDVVGQNFKYDYDKIRRLGFMVRSLASDTMLKGFAISPEFPKGLGFLTSIHTEEPFYKNEGMYEGSVRDLMIGCARDACVTKECDLVMEEDLRAANQYDYYYNFIIHLHQFYLDMENEGFNVNSEKRELLYKKYIHWSEELAYELFHLNGTHINTASPKQISILLYENFKIPHRGGTGEEEITAILNSQGLKLSDNQRRTCEIILEKRRVDKTIGTYLEAMPDFDGKMKSTFFPCLDTGRSSSGQQDPPIRPMVDVLDLHGKKKKKVLGTAFQTMTKHGDIGQDVRGQYEPDKGYVFVQLDSAQAEARVVFLLADDEDALYQIDHHDYHALTASWFFGGTEENYSKKSLGYESPIRFVGKTLRHAGHLGATKSRAAKTVNTDARKYKIKIQIDEKFAGQALKIFHDKQPKIRQVFHKGIEDALRRDKRYLTSGLPYGIASKVGGRRQFLDRWSDELLRAALSYIPQRSISDNTKAAGLRIKKREPKLARIILECHDSLLFMIPEKEVDYFIPFAKEEMERPIKFETCSLERRDLVIPCEAEVGYNYEELVKYKRIIV
jgi:uracil-DNA glycosylase family 4